MERIALLFQFHSRIGLLSAFQLGFIPGDLTINQLAHVYHIMRETLDRKKEASFVFCDISKSFDRV